MFTAIVLTFSITLLTVSFAYLVYYLCENKEIDYYTEKAFHKGYEKGYIAGHDRAVKDMLNTSEKGELK